MAGRGTSDEGVPLRGGPAPGTDRRGAIRLTIAAASASALLPHGGAHAQVPAAAPVGAGPPRAMTPDYRAGWTLHATSADAGATQLARGVELFAGDPRPSTTGVALWARAPVAGDFAAGFGYTRLDDERAAPPERGMATLFYWGTLGEGTAAWPADVSAWDGYTDAEPVIPPTYARHARGIRLSFNTFSPRPRFSDQVRARYFFYTTDEARPAIPPDSQEVFRFPTGERREVAIERRGSALTFAAGPPGGPVTRQRFAHPFIGEYRDGWVGFVLMPGRRCRIEDFGLVTG